MTAIGNYRINEATITSLAISPSNANRVMIGTILGSIHVSDRALGEAAGQTWNAATPRQGYVSALAFDPSNDQIAYAAYATFGGTHVWKSLDGGASWTSTDGAGPSAIPDIPVNAIAIDPNASSRVFLGTDLGVFVSLNGGTTWAVESGVPRVPVTALVFNTVAGTTSLHAFTHGRGL